MRLRFVGLIEALFDQVNVAGARVRLPVPLFRGYKLPSSTSAEVIKVGL